ncbi:MAG: hypothetical protein ACRDA4_01550 [Filifactoraceae bacterium]
MKKSMYSLMLMDDLIVKVDKLAYTNNTNRSNMINQILAEYLSFTTPEMRVREIVEKITDIIHDMNTFQVQKLPSDQSINIKSSLSYKYRPTIKYTVEFNKAQGREIGVLKINFRTQSNELLKLLDEFFRVWIAVEEKYLGRMFPKHELEYLIGEGRLNRTFICHDNLSLNSDILSKTIANYIRTFDAALKTYFDRFNLKDIEKYYISYLEKNEKLI